MSQSIESVGFKNPIQTLFSGSHLSGLDVDSAKNVLTLMEACEEQASTEQMKRSRIENAPQLPAPKQSLSVMLKAAAAKEPEMASISEKSPQDPHFNAGSVLVESLSSLRQLLHDGNISELSNRLKLLNIESNALNEKATKLLDTFAENTHQADAYKEKAVALIKVRDESENHLRYLQSLQGGDQQEIKRQISDEKTKIASLDTKITELSKTAVNYASKANEDRENLNQFIETAPQRVEIDGEKWENTLALLTMLTGQLKKLINEDSIRNMKEQEEQLSIINEASRKNSEAKAKEAAEAERKAAEANKAASCASKIFSYVMLAVSVVATVATFGAAAPLTVAVAAIGIAISVTDIVLEETGQSSLMQMLATEISNGVTDMLISFGVPEEQAKKIGSIVGMVVAAIAFLALSLASMSSFVKNIAKTATNAVKILAKNSGALLKSIIKSMPTSLTNALGNIANSAGKVGQSADDMVMLTKFTKLADNIDDLQNAVKTTSKLAQKADDMKDVAKAVDKTANSVKTQSVGVARLEVAAKGTGAVLTVANTATTGGLNVYSASQIRDMKERLADMLKNNSMIEAVGELFQNLLKLISQLAKKLEGLFSDMLESLDKSNRYKTNAMKPV
ncbi:TPA: type III secretion system translocon subunit SctE [Providencia rettgeri]